MNNKDSGINIDLGNQCSQIAYNWAKKTFSNRKDKPGDQKLGIDGAFSNVINFNGIRLGISSDGIGTKIELAERCGIYHTLGYDLVAMVVDDLAANGFEATNISNILDVDFLDSEIVDKLMQGLADASQVAKVSVPGGEIAELGSRIGGWGSGMHFNWCSTAIGFLPATLTEPISGISMKAGDAIISLASRGFRSNGFSLIRKVMQDKFGNNWHDQKFSDATWGEILLTPSLIFAPLISKILNSGFQINGIAHITGGGIADNLNRVLRINKLGAILDNLFPPHDFMKILQEYGRITEQEAYRIWNMGNAMLIAVDSNDAQIINNFIQNNNYVSRIAGMVLDEQQITIQAQGCFPQKLIYDTTEMRGK